MSRYVNHDLAAEQAAGSSSTPGIGTAIGATAGLAATWGFCSQVARRGADASCDALGDALEKKKDDKDKK